MPGNPITPPADTLPIGILYSSKFTLAVSYGDVKSSSPPKTASAPLLSASFFASPNNFSFKLDVENKLEQILLLLKSGVSVEGLTRGMLFTGFIDGKWNVDLALLLTEIVFNQVLAIGVKAKIKNIKVLSSDNSNAEFREEYGKLMSSKNKLKEQGIKEVKEDIKQFPETVGLMSRTQGE